MDAGIAKLTGLRILGLTVDGRLPELVIALSGGRWLHSFMTEQGQPDWTVFLRDGSWVNVVSGLVVHDTQNQKVGQRHRASSA